ncbi:MAG: triose-phosphate isomerase [Bacteroidales bacterium]|jgi:triosephosphate isomerase|nr:triose-phosphate isomerase [Bacteroidales bacterium]
MRKKIVAGNWKMNKNFQQAEELLNELAELVDTKAAPDVNVVVCPPSVFVEMALDLCRDEQERNIYAVGAQDVSTHTAGAYTGEVSAEMLKSMEAEYCIVGHSERRKYHNETNAEVGQKVENLLQNGLIPIVCVGESLEERENGTLFDVIKAQLTEGLFNLQAMDFSHIVIAYEPVWAIGTGKTATNEQAEEMHKYIRSLVEEKYGKEIARNLSILYGGSCTPQTAPGLFAQPDIDGGLIGGASLKAEDFVKIVNSFGK